MIVLAPNMQRPFGASAVAAGATVASSQLARMLDCFAGAVFMLDSAALILHANEKAEAMMAEGRAVRRGTARLAFFDRQAQATLTETLSLSDGKQKAEKQVFPIRSLQDRYMATLVPLPRAPAAPETGPVAILCLKSVSFSAAAYAPALTALYGLTRRESAILVASIDIGSVSKIAATMGLAESTIRTHLKSIFRKTGAARQADLVRLVAAIAGPFD